MHACTHILLIHTRQYLGALNIYHVTYKQHMSCSLRGFSCWVFFFSLSTLTLSEAAGTNRALLTCWFTVQFLIWLVGLMVTMLKCLRLLYEWPGWTACTVKYTENVITMFLQCNVVSFVRMMRMDQEQMILSLPVCSKCQSCQGASVCTGSRVIVKQRAQGGPLPRCSQKAVAWGEDLLYCNTLPTSSHLLLPLPSHLDVS